MEFIEYYIYFKNGTSHPLLVELGEKGTYKYYSEIESHKVIGENISKIITSGLEGELELSTTIGIVKIRLSEVQMLIINGLE